MKTIKLLSILTAALILPCYSAISSSMIFEVSTTGSNSNGGCFKEGASGTDFTINAGAYNFTNLVIDATTNTKVTSASHNFVTADVGNCLRITAGTGFTTGVFEIVSVASNAATLDRSAGTLGSTGGTFFVGGPLLTLSQLNTDMCTNCRAYVHGNGTYTTTSTITFNWPGGFRGWVKGYQTTRGDDLPFTIQATGAFAGDMLDNSVAHQTVYNVILDANSQSGVRCFGISAGESSGVNLECKNFSVTSQTLFPMNTRTWYRRIYLHDGTAASSFGIGLSGTESWCVDCVVRNVAGASFSAINIGDTSICVRCAVDSLTGATSAAFYCNGSGGGIEGASVYNVTGDAVNMSNQNCNEMSIFNMVVDTATTIINNTSGNGGRTGDILNDYIFYVNISGTAFTNAVAGPHVTALSISPFQAPASHDLRLNNKATGGKVVRGAGYPQTINGLVGNNYPDSGVMQHQDPKFFRPF